MPPKEEKPLRLKESPKSRTADLVDDLLDTAIFRSQSKEEFSPELIQLLDQF
jgi:hypothetical protein